MSVSHQWWIRPDLFEELSSYCRLTILLHASVRAVTCFSESYLVIREPFYSFQWIAISRGAGLWSALNRADSDAKARIAIAVGFHRINGSGTDGIITCHLLKGIFSGLICVQADSHASSLDPKSRRCLIPFQNSLSAERSLPVVDVWDSRRWRIDGAMWSWNSAVKQKLFHSLREEKSVKVTAYKNRFDWCEFHQTRKGRHWSWIFSWSRHRRLLYPGQKLRRRSDQRNCFLPRRYFLF